MELLIEKLNDTHFLSMLLAAIAADSLSKTQGSVVAANRAMLTSHAGGTAKSPP